MSESATIVVSPAALQLLKTLFADNSPLQLPIGTARIVVEIQSVLQMAVVAADNIGTVVSLNGR